MFRDITAEELQKILADNSLRSFGLDVDRSGLDEK